MEASKQGSKVERNKEGWKNKRKDVSKEERNNEGWKQGSKEQ